MPGSEALHVALADDHDLMRAGIADLLHGSERCRVTVDARNGHELVQALVAGAEVALAIVDLAIPVIDSYAVANDAFMW
ncbi:MAG: response regulator transcription factor [Flavobacteriales bacterium]|nr:response regulator transcription factor [Flavobacteriales bacterium]